MTVAENETICLVLASFFCPPDQEIMKQIRGETFRPFLERWVKSRNGDLAVLDGFQTKGDPEMFLEDLEKEYRRLFSEISGEGISLVESSYKPWTLDPFCTLPFASERGLLMGDSALHLLEIFHQCGLEVSEDKRGTPDHLTVELDFLSALYRSATDLEVGQFIKDHLDWIPLMREKMGRSHLHPFYRSALAVLDLFLSGERERLEGKRNGEKAIH